MGVYMGSLSGSQARMTMMLGLSGLCLASIFVQVYPLPVESSLPPINWDNIKAKYPTLTPWAPGNKLPPGFISQDSLGPPAPVPHPGYKKGAVQGSLAVTRPSPTPFPGWPLSLLMRCTSAAEPSSPTSGCRPQPTAPTGPPL